MNAPEGIRLLLAIEELKALQARRVRAIDSQDWDLYRTCHAEDFTSFTLGNPIYGIDGVIEGLKTALAGVTSAHHVMLPELSFESANAASGTWILHDRLWWAQDGEAHWMKGWGHYHDTYAVRQGRWVFMSRRIVRSRVEHSVGARMIG